MKVWQAHGHQPLPYAGEPASVEGALSASSQLLCGHPALERLKRLALALGEKGAALPPLLP